MEDFALLELEDEAGGTSPRRPHPVAGPAPRGAHHLPLPGDDALRCKICSKSWVCANAWRGAGAYDERHLCHSPQERLFFNGDWQPACCRCKT
ncbi:MAG: hypothetical protein IPN53_00025 [Comamonadaceae bacterium]|nr:hypothetical protein [Comamonadaceae bacterium]